MPTSTTPNPPVIPDASDFPTLSGIRKTCAFVTDHAQHVHLNHENLKNFAKTITTPPEHWLTTNPHNLLALPLPLLATILLYFEVIDYSFWPDPTNNSPTVAPTTKISLSPKTPQTVQRWTIETPSGPLDGSVALLYLLIKNFEQNPTLDFSNFSDADFHHFFQPIQNSTNSSTNSPSEAQAKAKAKAAHPTPEIPLLSARAETLRETSRILREQLNNNFYTAIQNFTSDEQLFHFLVTAFPSFRDQRTYTPKSTSQNNNSATAKPTLKTVHFYKLAQLLTSDLLFIRHHLEDISIDTSHLPGCADYKIPQALRTLNLISYDEELSTLVDSLHLIPVNSPHEVEIRAATVSAITFLHNELPEFSPIQINDYLFLASRNLPKKQPYHLTRTNNY